MKKFETLIDAINYAVKIKKNENDIKIILIDEWRDRTLAKVVLSLNDMFYLYLKYWSDSYDNITDYVYNKNISDLLRYPRYKIVDNETIECKANNSAYAIGEVQYIMEILQKPAWMTYIYNITIEEE